MKRYIIALVVLVFLGLSTDCLAQKKKKQKDQMSLPGRVYHNLTAHYNGYFNAKELYDKSEESLADSHQDNYNQVLEMYKYVPADAKAVDNDMETAIQKVSVVIRLHRKSDWTDDAYLLLGQCRYLQKDYEGAQEAFEYLAAEYNLKALEQKKLKRKSKKGQQKAKAKAKKKRQQMKKKGIEEKPEKYPLETRPAYEDGQIWLARTMIERGLYDEAELLMTRMKNDLKTHKDMADEIAEVNAYNWLKQGEYEKAIQPLEEALELTKTRKKKVRFSYILAQIYQQGGQDEKAYAYFNKVLKLGPTYDMEFNARLNMVTSSWLAGKESSEDVLRSLKRMLKDSKNKEYKDRIYFTMAKVHLKDKSNPEAIAALQKSLQFSSGNQAQKAESYLLLGDLYYGTEEYVLSKNYFDSTLLTMNETDVRKDRVQRMSSNLTDIAKNIEIISLQDSLLAINDMTPGQKRKLAAKLIKEKEDKLKSQQSAALANAAASGGGSTNLLGASKSLFFAYNDRSAKRGKKAFEKKWGARSLEDDWRRSVKNGGFNNEEEEVSDEKFAETLSDEQVAEVFAAVPDTPEKITAANEKIRVAMFSLGTLFRDKIQNNDKSIETLEELLKRYPDTSDKLDAYYNLYLAYTEKGNKKRAKYYYDKIVKEFPNTTYARALEDPNFLKETQEKEKEVVRYYDATYALFEKGDYEQALKKAKDSDSKFGVKNKLKPKFSLLSALCVGSIDGKEAYIKALKEVIAKYPDTPEQMKAKEILRLLQGGKPVASVPPKSGDTASDGPKDTDNKDNPPKDGKSGNFSTADDKSHYFMMVLKDGNQLKEAKNVVNAYNSKNFSIKNLRANSIFLGTTEKTPIIIVRRFRNKDDAMSYYEQAVAQPAEILGEGVEADFCVVAQANYREILKLKGMGDYMDFFRDNYLK